MTIDNFQAVDGHGQIFLIVDQGADSRVSWSWSVLSAFPPPPHIFRRRAEQGKKFRRFPSGSLTVHLKSGCLKVDMKDLKDFAEIQSKLMQCKLDEIDFIQSGAQKTIKTETKSISEAVRKLKGEVYHLSQVSTVQ